MDNENERTRLIFADVEIPQERPYRKWLLAAFVLIALLCFVLTGIYIAFVYFAAISHENVERKYSLQEILPNSFRARLEFADVHTTGKDEQVQSIELEWNKDEKDIRYQETRTHLGKFTSSDSSGYLTRFIYANNAAVFRILHKEDAHWFCQTNIDYIEWFTVFQIMLENQLLFENKNSNSNNNNNQCFTTDWKSRDPHQNIVVCLQGTTLLSVQHNGKLARVTQWDSNTAATIHVPNSFKNCSVSLQNISRIIELISISDNATDFQGSSMLGKEQRKNITCLFIHGAGEVETQAEYEDLADFSQYWGPVANYTPQCTERRFIKYDSVNRAWDDEGLHKIICEFATRNASDTIRNSLIFSHSMGNLVFAAALHRKICKFDTTSSQWFSAMGPWSGSKVGEIVVKLCTENYTGDAFIRSVLNTLNYCNKTMNGPSKAYIAMTTTYKSAIGVSYENLINTAQKYVSGILCGTSALGVGLSWQYTAELYFVQKFALLETPNDGLVPLNSCWIKGNFSSNPSSNYYKAPYNHAEGRCMFGGQRFFTSSVANPCKWYTKWF